MEKKQTAVEWLVKKLPTSVVKIYQREINYAKKIEKQNIINAWIVTENELQRIQAEKYYNETFKSE